MAKCPEDLAGTQKNNRAVQNTWKSKLTERGSEFRSDDMCKWTQYSNYRFYTKYKCLNTKSENNPEYVAHGTGKIRD